MKSYTNYILVVLGLLLTISSNAQADLENASLTHDIGKKKMIYFGNAFDAAVLTTGIGNGNNPSATVSTPRFTYFFNFGFNMHADFSNTIGLVTGLGIKNIGFIEKTKRTNPVTLATVDSTVKRRVYTVGLPIGVKIGNLKRRNFIVLGGGVDFPINYREKGFVKRGNKDKFNEWFSDRTPKVMPYVFAGASIDPGVVFKVQYYPTNFMNTDYTAASGNLPVPLVVSKPYAAYDVQLLMFSIGFDIHYNDKRSKKKEKAIKSM